MVTEGVASHGSLLELDGAIFDARFRIEERIAEGGFAVVYRAWQMALERRVALKVLKVPRHQHPAARAEFREKFAAEAKTIARLRHPDIVDVFDSSVATLPSGELAPWMALEWLEGETLAHELGQRRQAGQRGRAPVEALALLRPVLQALTHAHALGIVHRDIKPSNVMVTQGAAGPALRVLDFGIAKIMGDEQAPRTGNTRTESTPAFSPAYAAPEQVTFSRTGPWTDVHALGLLLSEVMTDEPPFSDADPDGHLFEQVMAAQRPTPARKGREVGLFEPVIARALALSPRDRWRNAGELLAALEEAAAGRPIAAPALRSSTAPPSTEAAAGAAQGRRLRLRGPALLAVAVAAVLVPVAVVGLTRRPAPEPAPVASPSANTGMRTPVPASAPATAASDPPAPLAVGAATPPAPRKKRARAGTTAATMATAPTATKKVEDGRDLFNDTK